MKRIAVLFFGQPRFAMDQNIVKNRSLLLKGSSDIIDIYSHMWYDEKNLLAQTVKWQVNSEDVKIQQNVAELFLTEYHPIKMKVDTPKSFQVTPPLKSLFMKRFRHNINDIDTFISGMVSQLYSMQAVSELCYNHCLNQNIQYDLVMFLRYDTIFLQKLNFTEFDQNYLYLDHLPHFFPDIWVICGFKYLQWSNDLYSGLQEVKYFYKIQQCSPEQIKKAIFLKHFDPQCIRKVNIPFFVKRTPNLLTSSQDLERRISI